MKPRKPVRSIHGCCIPAKYRNTAAITARRFGGRQGGTIIDFRLPFHSPRIFRGLLRQNQTSSISGFCPLLIVLRVTTTEYASSSSASRTHRMYFRTEIAVYFMFADEADRSASDQQIKTTAETDACVSTSMSALLRCAEYQCSAPEIINQQIDVRRTTGIGIAQHPCEQLRQKSLCGIFLASAHSFSNRSENGLAHRTGTSIDSLAHF